MFKKKVIKIKLDVKNHERILIKFSLIILLLLLLFKKRFYIKFNQIHIISNNVNMNSNSFTYEKDKLEKYLLDIGNSWILEAIYLYTVAPFGVIAILLNIISLITLLKFQNVKRSQYKYLKVFTLNSLLLSMMIFFFIFTHIPRYNDFSLTYFARFYRCVIMINVANMLNFYEGVLNILIILERMSNFVLKFKKLTQIPPYLTSIGFLIICIIICLPTFKLSTVKSEDDFLKAINNYNESNKIFRYCEKTEFSQSLIGKIIIAFVILVMNGITLIIEVTCTIVAIYNFRKYLESRANLLNNKNDHNRNDLRVNYQNGVVNLDFNGSRFDISINNTAGLAQENFKQASIRINNANKNLSKVERNLTKMSIRFAILSSISNLCILFYNLFVLFVGDDNFFYYYLVFSACLFTLIKLSANFIFYYRYNKNFQVVFRNFFINTLFRKLN